MAARQQPKGTGLAIQYEDLVPKSEWKDQPEATLLTIDLPGFGKEQIKVTYVHASKMIRVTGERPLADRKWSRFNEVFTVPQNCLVDKIHGSFKNNVLTITMPKEKLANIPEASKTVAEKVEKMEKLEEKRLWEESRRKEEAEKKRNKELMEEKEALIKKLQEEAKAKEKAEAAKKLEEEVRAKKKLEEEAKAKEKAEAAKKLEEEAKAKEKAEAAKKLEEEVRAKKKLEEEKKLVEEARLIEKKSLVDKEKIVKPEERKLPEVVYTKPGTGTGTGIGTGSGSKPGLGGVGEVVKTAEEKLGYLVEKEKKIGKGIMEKIRKKEITSEEKKLMVNVGVAALVIFALGAYVSYTFCSSSSSSSSSSSPSSSSSTKPE